MFVTLVVIDLHDFIYDRCVVSTFFSRETPIVLWPNSCVPKIQKPLVRFDPLFFQRASLEGLRGFESNFFQISVRSKCRRNCFWMRAVPCWHRPSTPFNKYRLFCEFKCNSIWTTLSPICYKLCVYSLNLLFLIFMVIFLGWMPIYKLLQLFALVVNFFEIHIYLVGAEYVYRPFTRFQFQIKQHLKE